MVTIQGTKYAPKIKNSILLRFASERDIDLTKLDKVLGKFNYNLAADLFAFAVNHEGGNLTVAEIDAEVDNRMDAFGEIMNHIATELNPTSSLGEGKPVKTGRKK